jgi:hypothetical protein
MHANSFFTLRHDQGPIIFPSFQSEGLLILAIKPFSAEEPKRSLLETFSVDFFLFYLDDDVA